MDVASFVITVMIDGNLHNVYVLKRPGESTLTPLFAFIRSEYIACYYLNKIIIVIKVIIILILKNDNSSNNDSNDNYYINKNNNNK